MSKKKQYWSLFKAIDEAEKQGIEVSRPTLVKWIKRYGIGFQLGDKGGKWYVYPEKFTRMINNGKTNQNNNIGSAADTIGSTDDKPTEAEKCIAE